MVLKYKIRSTIENLRVIENAIDDLCMKFSINHDYYGNIMVSVLEAVNNAIVHGNDLNPKKKVHVVFDINNDVLEVTVADQGKGFDPATIEDPTSPENIERVNGRGVFIMTKLSDNIKFKESGTVVTMTFRNIL